MGPTVRYRLPVSTTRTIATQTHGRYVFEAAPGHPTRPLLVGFHGYGERAEDQFERLRSIRGSSAWDVVAVQALHRFYPRDGDRTGASWMTRDDREVTIGDNLQYVDRVLADLADELGQPTSVVFAGFSQGASMAYRAAALGRRSAGVVACGGDIPPELTDEQLSRIRAVLIAWGARDRFYTEAKRDADASRLSRAGVAVTVATFEVGHAWTEDVSSTAHAWVSGVV